MQVNVIQYNVTWLHYKYLACNKKVTNTQSRGQDLKVPSNNYIIENQLESYSKYEVFIGGTTFKNSYEVGSASAIFDTKPSEPETRLGETVINISPGIQSLQFTWDRPDCKLQNGQFDQYYVELQGLDEWAVSNVRLLHNTTYDEFV